MWSDESADRFLKWVGVIVALDFSLKSYNLGMEGQALLFLIITPLFAWSFGAETPLIKKAVFRLTFMAIGIAAIMIFFEIIEGAWRGFTNNLF